MGWNAESSNQLVAQFHASYGRARCYKHRDHVCDRDAWGMVVMKEPSKRDLRKMFGVVAGFLLTETECERNFVVERRQSSARPRMNPGTRHMGLKIMVDGVPFSRLQVDGQPINDFWQCCQDRYAEKFGTKRLGDRKTRSDAGKHHHTPKRRRDGKFTMASIRRDRREAIAAPPPIPFGGRVFGHRAMSQPTLGKMCKAAESQAFLKIMEKMKKKHDNMHATIARSLAAPAGSVRLSAMTTRQRQRLVKQQIKARKVLVEFGFACKSAISASMFARRLQGLPLVLLEAGSVDGLAGRGLDEVYMGKPLRDLVFAGSCADYVRSPHALARRVIVVRTLASIPEDLHLAAMLLGARVQEQVLIPGLHFTRRPGWAIACTPEFRKRHAAVVRVIDAAMESKRAASMSVAKLCLAWGVLRPGQRQRLRKSWVLFYETHLDQGLSELADGAKDIARTFAEFLRTCTAVA